MNSDSEQLSDLKQDINEDQFDIIEDLKKIEENKKLKIINKEYVKKKPENYKTMNEDFNKKGKHKNFEERKTINKNKSKEREAYESEMDKIKRNDLNRFFSQFTYQFYY